MTKERKLKPPFDDDWSRRKNLCYDLACCVIGNLLHVRLIVKQDRN